MQKWSFLMRFEMHFHLNSIFINCFLSSFRFQESHYPLVSIDPNLIIKPPLLNIRVSDAFIERQVSPFKKAFNAFLRKGFVAGFTVLASIECEHNIWLNVVKKFASTVLYLWNMILVIYAYFFPYSLMHDDELCAQFSRCLDHTSHIRCFAWHPVYIRCAVALSNHNVHIYSASNSSSILVRHKQQKKITDLAWKPTNEEILAVACHSVVLIWSFDRNSKFSQPVCTRIITESIFSPITCVSFDRSGELLGICSPSTSKLLFVKPTNSEQVLEQKIVRKFGSGFSFLKWSPDKSRLMTGTTSNFIRVFENQKWSSKNWGKDFASVCQTACWSEPDGRLLLFALKNDCIVYAIAFFDKAQANDCGGTNSYIEVLNVSEIRLSDEVVVGGRIHEMLWDRHAERLAIMFKDNSRYIAIFKTRVKPNLEISPIGFIHGLQSEVPVVMNFHPAFKKGSLLSVCWSSGYVSHIPFEYTPNSKQNGLSHNTPRCLTSFCVASPSRNSSLCSPLKDLSNTSPLTFKSRDSVLSPRKPLLFSRVENGDNSL
ncbi:aladin-like protein [Dinothrombium tinctorium]|uniref:Aladin-like protein n=1 Tax=Dinothrombium tinctorium TaxID=1965070 RepID=A0A3S3QWD2_9ACAR|nr:aladin-like protein [Dinothrombium tinctorium]RWS15044.1 aladin-like protein [Dinothrombium tinctorium]